MPESFKLCWFVPTSHLEATKAAVFAAGGGRQGNYAECCFQTRGTGQFRPLAGSQPFIGTTDALEQVDEWRVEVLCTASCIEQVVEALRQAHPYEEPAIDVWRLEPLPR